MARRKGKQGGGGKKQDKSKQGTEEASPAKSLTDTEQAGGSDNAGNTEASESRQKTQKQLDESQRQPQQPPRQKDTGSDVKSPAQGRPTPMKTKGQKDKQPLVRSGDERKQQSSDATSEESSSGSPAKRAKKQQSAEVTSKSQIKKSGGGKSGSYSPAKAAASRTTPRSSLEYLSTGDESETTNSTSAGSSSSDSESCETSENVGKEQIKQNPGGQSQQAGQSKQKKEARKSRDDLPDEPMEGADGGVSQSPVGTLSEKKNKRKGKKKNKGRKASSRNLSPQLLQQQRVPQQQTLLRQQRLGSREEPTTSKNDSNSEGEAVVEIKVTRRQTIAAQMLEKFSKEMERLERQKKGFERRQRLASEGISAAYSCFRGTGAARRSKTPSASPATRGMLPRIQFSTPQPSSQSAHVERYSTQGGCGSAQESMQPGSDRLEAGGPPDQRRQILSMLPLPPIRFAPEMTQSSPSTASSAVRSLQFDRTQGSPGPSNAALPPIENTSAAAKSEGKKSPGSIHSGQSTSANTRPVTSPTQLFADAVAGLQPPPSESDLAIATKSISSCVVSSRMPGASGENTQPLATEVTNIINPQISDGAKSRVTSAESQTAAMGAQPQSGASEIDTQSPAKGITTTINPERPKAVSPSKLPSTESQTAATGVQPQVPNFLGAFLPGQPVTPSAAQSLDARREQIIKHLDSINRYVNSHDLSEDQLAVILAGFHSAKISIESMSAKDPVDSGADGKPPQANKGRDSKTRIGATHPQEHREQRIKEPGENQNNQSQTQEEAEPPSGDHTKSHKESKMKDAPQSPLKLFAENNPDFPEISTPSAERGSDVQQEEHEPMPTSDSVARILNNPVGSQQCPGDDKTDKDNENSTQTDGPNPVVSHGPEGKRPMESRSSPTRNIQSMEGNSAVSQEKPEAKPIESQNQPEHQTGHIQPNEEAHVATQEDSEKLQISETTENRGTRNEESSCSGLALKESPSPNESQGNCASTLGEDTNNSNFRTDNVQPKEGLPFGKSHEDQEDKKPTDNVRDLLALKSPDFPLQGIRQDVGNSAVLMTVRDPTGDSQENLNDPPASSKTIISQLETQSSQLDSNVKTECPENLPNASTACLGSSGATEGKVTKLKMAEAETSKECLPSDNVRQSEAGMQPDPRASPVNPAVHIPSHGAQTNEEQSNAPTRSCQMAEENKQVSGASNSDQPAGEFSPFLGDSCVRPKIPNAKNTVEKSKKSKKKQTTQKSSAADAILDSEQGTNASAPQTPSVSTQRGESTAQSITKSASTGSSEMQHPDDKGQSSAVTVDLSHKQTMPEQEQTRINSWTRRVRHHYTERRPLDLRREKSIQPRTMKDICCYLCNRAFEWPHLLACFHVYCWRCLVQMFDSAQKRIICPRCARHSYVDNPDRLLFDITGCRIMCEVLIWPFGCSVCSVGNDAEAYCHSCLRYFCPDCHEKHANDPSSTTHEVTTALKCTSTETGQLQPCCPTHRGVPLDHVYCRDCKLGLCRICLQEGTHTSHDTVTDVVVHNQLMEDSARRTERLRELADGMNHQLMMLNQTRQYNENQQRTMRRTLDEACRTYLAQIDEFHRTAIANNDSQYANLIEWLSQRLSEVVKYSAELQTFIQFTQRYATHPNMVETIKMFPLIRDQYFRLRQYYENNPFLSGDVRLTARFNVNYPAFDEVMHKIFLSLQVHCRGTLDYLLENPLVREKYETVRSQSPPYGLDNRDNTETRSDDQGAVGGSHDPPDAANDAHPDFTRETITCIRAFGRFGRDEYAYNEPSGVLYLHDGSLAVCDCKNHRIVVYNEDGSYMRTIGESHDPTPSLEGPPEKLYFPFRIAQCPRTRYIAILQHPPSNEVRVLSLEGYFIRSFGREVLKKPRALTVDDRGNTLVLCSRYMKFVIFNPAGLVEKISFIPEHLDFPNDITSKLGKYIFISDNRFHCVKIFNYDLELLETVGNESLTYYPIGVAFNHLNQMVITDNHNTFNITVFDRDGRLLYGYKSQYKHANCFNVALHPSRMELAVSTIECQILIFRYDKPKDDQKKKIVKSSHSK